MLTYTPDDFADGLPEWVRSAGDIEDFRRAVSECQRLIVVHTGRCGSSYLSSLIKARGVFLDPTEHFNGSPTPSFLALPEVQSGRLTDILIRLSKRSDIGRDMLTFALSVTPWQIYRLADRYPEVFKLLFDGSVVIQITRRDLLAQAMSHAVAGQTGFWHARRAEEVDRRHVDLAACHEPSILGFVDLILAGEQEMDSGRLAGLMSGARARLSCTYESLTTDPDMVLGWIADELPSDVVPADAGDVTRKLQYSADFEAKRLALTASLPVDLPSGHVLTEDMLRGRRAGEGLPTLRGAARDGIRDGFQDEYDAHRLVQVLPDGQPFAMLVTPRYVGHYDGRRYEGFTARYVAAILRRPSIFVDIGAHYGFFSLIAAHANPEGRIIAVEPVSQSRAILHQNLRPAADGRISVRPEAISDRDGEAVFQISLSSDNCSFYLHPNAPPLASVTVATTSVDRLLESFDVGPLVVKIDTDGHELAVLAGMSVTLERFVDLTLIIELNPKMQAAAGHGASDLLRRLDDLGFTSFLIDDDRERVYRIEPDQDLASLMNLASYANVVCRRKETALGLVYVSHSAHLNGAERSLLGLVEDAVGHRGALATVVLPGEGPLASRLRAAGASVLTAAMPWWCDFRSWPAADHHARLSASLVPFVTELLPALRSINPDVVVTQTIVSPWGALAAASLGRPHIWSACEYGELDHGLNFLAPLPEITAAIESLSDYIFSCSRDVRDVLFAGGHADRHDVLYRHVEVDATQGPELDRPRVPGRLRAGIFGTVSEGKGQADAVEALARLRARGVDAELIIVGSANAAREQRLRELIRARDMDDVVVLTGFIDPPHRVMQSCDVVLSLARREAFGRTLVEAMLLERPVIYSVPGGSAELMRSGETGFAIAHGDVDAIAGYLEQLAADPDLCARIGHAGRTHALATFTRDGFGGKLFRQALALRQRKASAATSVASVLAGVIDMTISGLAAGAAQRVDSVRAVSAAALRDIEHRVAQLTDLLAEAEVRRAAGDGERLLLAARLADIDLGRATLAGELARVEDERRSLQQKLAALVAAFDDSEMERRSLKQALASHSEALATNLAEAAERQRLHQQSVAWQRAGVTTSENDHIIAYLRITELQLQLTSSRYLSRALVTKLQHTPREVGRRLRHSLRKRRREIFDLAVPLVARIMAAMGPERAWQRSAVNTISCAALRVLIRQRWLFSERRLQKFQRSLGRRVGTIGPDLNRVAAGDGTVAGRHEAQHPAGFRAAVLSHVLPLERQADDRLDPSAGVTRVPADVLAHALRSALTGSTGAAVVSIAHDDYRGHVGGVQLCVGIEQLAFAAPGRTYLHLSPARPLPILAPAADNFAYRVIIDGTEVGFVTAADVVAVVAAMRDEGRGFEMVVHHLLGHAPELIADLYRAAGGGRAIFWAHDFFGLCPNFTLMRNAIRYCGAPPPASAACGICVVGQGRAAHLERMRRLFDAIPFEIVAPSQAAADVWRDGSVVDRGPIRVHPHKRIVPAAVEDPRVGGRLTVAFPGHPVIHKGWPLFREFVNLQGDDDSVGFLHLGASRDPEAPDRIAFVNVSVSAERPGAMSSAIIDNAVDAVFLCSLWPETFSFTAVEALAGGASIITLETSGNIAAIVRQHECGIVFADEAALFAAVTDGTLVAGLRQRARRRFETTFTRFTADILAPTN